MMRCPTLIPPLSAIPPRIRLQIVPFCTLNPNWYLKLGLFINTVVVGGHCTIVNLVAISDFKDFNFACILARLRPTTLVPSIARSWSPTFRSPDLAAGPVGLRLAMTKVGTTDPQPDSMTTIPVISPFCLKIVTSLEASLFAKSIKSSPFSSCKHIVKKLILVTNLTSRAFFQLDEPKLFKYSQG